MTLDEILKNCQWDTVRAYDATWQRDEQTASQFNACLDQAKAQILQYIESVIGDREPKIGPGSDLINRIQARNDLKNEQLSRLRGEG